jgi:hypothetical protein
MKIKILRAVNGFHFVPGDEVDVDRHLARAWIEDGIAVPIPEAATLEVSETAMMPSPARKRRKK